ncbi:MAG: 6-bladed beta-propeller [bacterium]|nr:6-bladed beta-propeller [bacterium]
MRGQSLIEVVIAMAIGVIMIAVSSGTIALVLQSNQLSQNNQTASELAVALADNLSVLTESNWHNIYDLNKGSGNKYYIATSSGVLVIQSGEEQIIVDGIQFARYFYAENVSRNSGGNIESVYNVSNDDPSTQKATLVTNWIINGSNSVTAYSIYLTRWRNRLLWQTDWSGGSGQEGPVSQINNKFDSYQNVNFSATPGSIVPVPVENSFIYVADTGNNRIQKFDSDGVYKAQWNGSLGAGGLFDTPQGISVDSAYNIYVADTKKYILQKFTNGGDYISSWGDHGGGEGEFEQPMDIAVDSSDNVYVIDYLNDRVEKFNSSGIFIKEWAIEGQKDVKGHGIEVDSQNNIYIVDSSNELVKKFTSEGVFIKTWGTTGSGDGQFKDPHGIGIDDSNYIYIADVGNSRVQKFDSEGVFLGWWGKDNVGFTGWHNPGSGKTGVSGVNDGQFQIPEDVVVDEFDYIYVVDSGRDDVQRFNSAGVFQNKWGEFGSGQSQFNNPTSITTSFTQCTGGSETCNLISSIFDTGVSGGAAFNTLMWQGTQLSGSVIFKIASSNSSGGPWNYVTTLNPGGPNVQVKIDSQHNNKRYIRYKLIMDSDQSNSPKVEDVIINWSP